MHSTIVTIESAKFAFIVAVMASLALTPMAGAVARKLGVVDAPDGGRKRHGRSVPLWGGAAVYAALVAGLLVARLGAAGGPAMDQLSTTLILACGLVCLVGCIDDARDLHARFKLLLQIVAVLPVVLAGYSFDRTVLFGYPLELGWFGVPLTILWLVGCINAINLLDGLDGLASVVGISAALMMAVIAIHTGHAHVGVVALVLAGALVGFLVYNLPPASIFLGDSGSMVIGLVVGLISIQGALKTSATLSITIPAIVMSVPMLDTLLAIVRRKLAGKPFDSADRGHIHHRLLERGLSDWQALCIIGGLCLTTGIAATAATLLHIDAVGWITVIALVVLLVRTRSFGHHEVELAKEQLSAGLDRCRAVLNRGAESAERPGAVVSCEDAWRDLVAEAARRGARGFELLLANHAVQERYSWRSPALPLPSAIERPLVVTFARPDGTTCQLQLLGLQSEAERDSLPALTAILDNLAHQWRIGGATLPPVDLTIECHLVPTRGWRPAA